MWKQILKPTETTSRVFYVSQPMIILAEGTFGSRTVTVEMRRRGSTNPWVPVNVVGGLVASDPVVALGGIPDTEYRVGVSAAGLSIFYNETYPVQE